MYSQYGIGWDKELIRAVIHHASSLYKVQSTKEKTQPKREPTAKKASIEGNSDMSDITDFAA